MNPVLREKNPALADYLEQLSAQFERAFDLAGNVAEQANLLEGVKEYGHLIASNSKSASLRVDVGDDGVTRITISIVPG